MNTQSYGFLTASAKFAIVAIATLSLAVSSSSAWADQKGEEVLQQVLEAHGGLDNWRAHGTLAYTMTDFPLSEQIARENRSTVDLHTRNNHIEGPGYTVGFDGQNAWSVPAPTAAGIPSRFVSLGSFYFVGIPFVLADPGVNVDWDGVQQFRGEDYNVLKITYGDGVGHSSDDNYAIFINPETNRVALIHHNVTELYDEATRVTWVYEDYANVSGEKGELALPSRLTFYQGWTSDPDPAKGASYTITNYELLADQPDPSLFQAPKGAFLNDTDTVAGA